MAYNKYCIREYVPKTQNQGSHAFYAEAVIDNEMTNKQIAEEVASMTGFKTYECRAMVAATCEVIIKAALNNQRVVLADENDNRAITIYPKANYSVSDLDIERETTAAHAVDPSVEIRTVATADDVIPKKIKWTLTAQVGVKFVKRFLDKMTFKRDDKTGIIQTDVPASTDNENPVDTSTGSNSGGDDIPSGNG